jgi:GNAT superfamily N-acetyltransferase
MEVKINSGMPGYIPGAIGRITELHAQYYGARHGFGLFFEAKVATEMSALLNNFHPDRDGFWTAVCDGQIIGSIAIDGSEAQKKGARLRWLIVAPEFQGRGTGMRLVESALKFCADQGFRKIYLTTFAGLDAARHIYEKAGFRLVFEERGDFWGGPQLEQRFEKITVT